MRYHVSVQQLEMWNGLTDHSTLHTGDRLVLAANDVHKAPPRQNSAGTPSRTTSSRSGGDTWVGQSSRDFGEQVVSYALRYLGTPYVYGGASPSGFDCSGFVMYVYAKAGVSLPHYSYSQFEMGKPVSLSALSPGDLVFFSANGPGPSHVGIYIGGGKFVSAAGSAVRVDSLSNSYWASHYVGARRVR
jgi:peptidoglycan endopeptidase LytE